MQLLGFTPADGRLIINLFRMNIRDRYLGSALGLFWAILNPMLMLGMYTFIFGFVFKARLPGAETTFAYSIWLISGMVPYMAVSEALSSTASSVVGGAGMVKNVVFKSETLPYASTLTAAVPFTVGMLFLFILISIDGNYPTWHIVLLVPLVLVQFAFLGGIGLFLAATTVFVRDVMQALSTIIMFLMFFTPIFYTIEMMPRMIQRVTFFNPLYQLTQPYRDIILYHRVPDLKGLCYIAVLAVLFNIAGLRYFRRLKGYFEIKL
jgi:lipopolysaccharide transport system permease protein